MVPEVRPSSRRWDVLLAVALVGLAFVPGVARQGVDLAELPDRLMDATGWVLVVAQGAPVAALRRWPAWSLAVVGTAFGAYQLMGYPTTFAALGLLVALVGAGALLEERRQVVGTIALAGYVLLAVGLEAVGSPSTVLDYLVFGLLLVLLWWAGTWSRVRAEAQARHTALAAREALAAERARIARELHDVVTHHVTAMVVQADAAQYGTTDAGRTSTVLATIGETGRAALTDLRDLLGALDGAAEPTREPVVLEIADLVERARSAGQAVDLVREGQMRPLAGAAGLAASRVVQESLTNAMKHAHGATTVVRVRYDEGEVDVRVTNDGYGEVGVGRGAGRGLEGLRERVALVGGELDAGPEGDGFVVHARVPA